METQPRKTSLSTSHWTIPNLLTISRVVLTPAFVSFFMDQDYLTALIIFVAAGLSDALDGTLARLLHQRSEIGAMLDPLADKLLLTTAFLSLAIKGWIPAWLTVIVVSREIIIVGGLLLLTFLGIDVRRRISPIFISKINTMAQMGLIVTVLSDKAFSVNLSLLALILIWTVGVLTALSGAHYLAKGVAFISPGEDRDKGGNGRGA